jgi:sporulation protein YlmC with PRC-barrel domain
MRITSTFFTCGALVLGLCATQARSQDDSKRTDPATAGNTAVQRADVDRNVSEAPARASKIIGTQIVDASGKDVWEIENLTVAPNGEVVALVKRHDDQILGIPLSYLDPRMVKSDLPEAKAKDELARVVSGETPDIKRFALRRERSWFEAAPTFTNMKAIDAGGLIRSTEYFAAHGSPNTHAKGSDAAPVEAGKTVLVQPVLFKALMGEDIETQDGVVLGDIKDIAINLGSHHVAYAIISAGGMMGMGAELHAVPFEDLVRTGERITVAMTKDSLAALPVLDLGRLTAGPVAVADEPRSTSTGTPGSR